METSRNCSVDCTRLYVETDIFADVDDVGALAVAHALVDSGKATLLGVGVNTPSIWGPRIVRCVNEFYGRASTPVGNLPQQDESVFDPDFARTVSMHFGFAENHNGLSATDLLLDLLDKSEDDTLTIVSLGFFGNLLSVIDSEDGYNLVERKVHRTVVMGGEFPTGSEWNFAQFPEETREFATRWPSRVDFVGFEVGVDVICGSRLKWPDYEENPVRLAYEAYNGRGQGRPSWDLIAIDSAVSLESTHYSWSPNGRVRILEDGSNEWILDPEGPHRFLSLVGTPEALVRRLDKLLSQSPNKRGR